MERSQLIKALKFKSHILTLREKYTHMTPEQLSERNPPNVDPETYRAQRLAGYGDILNSLKWINETQGAIH